MRLEFSFFEATLDHLAQVHYVHEAQTGDGACSHHERACLPGFLSKLHVRKCKCPRETVVIYLCEVLNAHLHHSLSECLKTKHGF